ncbi:MAG: HAMP domain-containing histidine kinase [Oscillospiraceae bacterium]|nr:HAMP domain-containing histidine kinase [Oscillospiraceae bacterium]
MLKQYHRRFIWLNMSIVGVVFALMLVLISVYLYHSYYDALRTTMSEVIKPLSSSSVSGGERLSESRSSPKDREKKSASTGEGTSSLTSEERIGINTVFYDADSGEITLLSRTLVFDKEILAQAIPEIAAQDDSFGVLKKYNMIYYCSGGNGDYRIAVTTTTYILEPMVQLVLLFTGIFALVMVLFYFISRRLAILAGQPLERAMEREKRFIADVSHDLKTPLTVILANGDILQSNAQASVGEQMQWIDSTQRAAHKMQRMVNELLTLSNIESPERVVQMEPVDFSEVAEKSLLQMESVAYDRGIALENRIQARVQIRANPDYLQRVVDSLIENALKYEPNGGSVHVCLQTQKGYAIFTVTNPHGVIAPEDLPHIFERFYRADKARSFGESHGLGLTIAKSMTEKMNGAIRAESSPETGTCFSLRFKCL